MTGDIPPLPEALLEAHASDLRRRYETLADPLAAQFAGRGLPLGPIQWGPQGKDVTLQVAYGGLYDGDDPNLSGRHEFTLTSDALEGSVYGLQFGPGGIREQTKQSLRKKTVYVGDDEARALLDVHLPYRSLSGTIAAGASNGADTGLAHIKGILGLTERDGAPVLTNPHQLGIGDKMAFETSGKLKYALFGTASAGPVTGFTGAARQADAKLSVEVRRLSEHEVEVTLSPQNLDTTGLIGGLTGVSGYAGKSLHTTLTETFSFDMRSPQARRAYRATVEGRSPSNFGRTLAAGADAPDAAAILEAFQREDLPDGVERTFIERAKIPLQSRALVTPAIPGVGRQGIQKLRAEGTIIVSDGELALTQETTTKHRKASEFFSGESRRSSGSAVQSLTYLDSDGAPQTDFGGVVLTAGFEDSKLTGRDFTKNIINPLNRALGLEINTPVRPGDGGDRRVDVELEVGAADLRRLTDLSDADLRTAAADVHMNPRALLRLRHDLAHAADSHAAGLRLQTFVKNRGFKGLSSVVRALDATQRLDVETKSSNYKDAITESHRFKTSFPQPVAAEGQPADLQLRFNSGYTAIKKIDVAAQDLRDDVVLRKFQPLEFDRRRADLEEARGRIVESMSIDHLSPAGQKVVLDKAGAKQLIFRADRLLAKYPEPIRADENKERLKKRFKQLERVVYNLDAKIGRIEDGDPRWVKPPFVANDYQPLDPQAETQRLVQLKAKRKKLEALLSVDHLSKVQRQAIRDRVLTTDSGLRLGDRRTPATQAILHRLGEADARDAMVERLAGLTLANGDADGTALKKAKMGRAAYDLARENPKFAQLVRDFERLHGHLPKFELVQDLPRPAGWDGESATIAFKEGSSQFDDAEKLQRRLVMELSNAIEERAYASVWERAKSGELDKDGFVREMERIEYEAVKRHHHVFSDVPNDPRDIFGDKLSNEWKTFDGFASDQSRTRGSVQDQKASHAELYEAAWTRATTGGERGYVFHATTPKGNDPDKELSDIEGLGDLTNSELLDHLSLSDDYREELEMFFTKALIEVPGLIRDSGEFTLKGLRTALYRAAALNPTAKSLLTEFDNLIPLPSEGGPGGFGILQVVHGQISERPNFSEFLQTALPIKRDEEHRRHIVAFHSLRAAFQTLLDSPEGKADLLDSIDASHKQMSQDIRASDLDGQSLREVLSAGKQQLEKGNLALEARNQLIQRLTFLDGVKSLVGQVEGDSETVGQLLDRWNKAPVSDDDKVKLALYQANSNPLNLWPGNGRENSAIAVAYDSFSRRLGKITDPESLIEIFQEWDSLEKGKSTIDPRATTQLVLKEILGEAANSIEGLATDEEKQRVVDDAKALAQSIIDSNLDVDILEQHKGRVDYSTRDNYLNYRTIKSGADAVFGLIDGDDVDMGKAAQDFIGRFLNYSPYSGLEKASFRNDPPIDGSVQGRLETLHTELLKNSHAYREAHRAATVFGGPVNIEVVDDAERVVSYDLDSNTIRVKKSSLEGSDTKLMSRIAFEMTNAANQSRFEGLVQTAEAFLKRREEERQKPEADRVEALDLESIDWAKVFAEQALRIEFDSLQAFEKIQSDMKSAKGTNLVIDSDVPSNWQSFLKSQSPAKKPKPAATGTEPDAKVSLFDHYRQEFARLEQAFDGGDTDDYSLQIWKPRGEPSADGAPGATEGTPNSDTPAATGATETAGTGHGGSAHSDGDRNDGGGRVGDGGALVGANGSADDARPGGTGHSNTGSSSGGGGRVGASDGPAGFLSQQEALDEEKEVNASFGGSTGFEESVGAVQFSGEASGGGTLEAGYTTNEDQTSGGAQAQLDGSVEVTIGAGPVSQTVGADAEIYAGGHGTIHHHRDGDDATFGADLYGGAHVNADVSSRTEFGDVAHAETTASVGAGASVEGSGKFIMRDGIPGVTVSGGFDAGISAGLSQTVGVGPAEVTGDAGVILGFSAGAGASVGMQEDGKFHVEFNVRLAIGVGIDLGLDLAIDVEKMKELVGKLDPKDWGPKVAEFVGGVLQDAGLLANEAIDFLDEKIVGPLKDGFVALGDGFMSAIRDIGDFFEMIGEEVKEFFVEDVPEFFTEDVPEFFEDVGDVLEDGVEEVGEFFTEDVPEFLGDAGEAIVDGGKTVWNAVTSVFKGW